MGKDHTLYQAVFNEWKQREQDMVLGALRIDFSMSHACHRENHVGSKSHTKIKHKPISVCMISLRVSRAIEPSLSVGLHRR